MQYFYSVRIFPGQEPNNVWVGWVTPDFHQYNPEFELHTVRTVTITLGDEKGKVHKRCVFIMVCTVRVPGLSLWFYLDFSSLKCSNCFMVWAGESCAPNEGRNNNGLEIGCLVDTTNGLLTFTANGKELTTHYQVNIKVVNANSTTTKTSANFSHPGPRTPRGCPQKPFASSGSCISR